MQLPDAHIQGAILQLNAAVGVARQQFADDPSNTQLAQRLARFEMVYALCKTYCASEPECARLDEPIQLCLPFGD